MHAEKWLVRLFMAIETLEEFPNRCPLVPETDALGFSAQQLIFGTGRGAFRIIFHTREDEKEVRILRIWHGYRGVITADDVEVA